MPALTAADLRVAALSDLNTRATGTAWSMLDILLPDVPGEPYGGFATRQQTLATVQATEATPPSRARPTHLRALLRSWAASQQTPAPAPEDR